MAATFSRGCPGGAVILCEAEVQPTDARSVAHEPSVGCSAEADNIAVDVGDPFGRFLSGLVLLELHAGTQPWPGGARTLRRFTRASALAPLAMMH